MTTSSTLHRFAFVIHPLAVSDLGRHPALRWTRLLPAGAVERVAARMPAFRLSRIAGIRSEATGEAAEGELYSLSATPRELLAMPARRAYDAILAVAREAASRGARLLGLGAYTHIVGDAGVTIARESPIPVTTGNSLTVAATLEAAKMGVRAMGHTDLAHGRAMVVGATGAIGAACSRLLARAVRDVVLVSIEPERLRALKAQIEAEVPGARVVIATDTAGLVAGCALVVTCTSAAGQRVLDVAGLPPGAVVCDVSRPFDVSPQEAAVRPDVLCIEAGEIALPGQVDVGFDIALPPGLVYACLGEAALLAVAGRFESFTLGRELDPERIKEIYRLARRHGARVAPLRSFGGWVGDADLVRRRELAAALRADPGLLAAARARAAERLAALPGRSKGVSAVVQEPTSDVAEREGADALR